jgi:O-antigen/teichoic acid export membrane protein
MYWLAHRCDCNRQTCEHTSHRIHCVIKRSIASIVDQALLSALNFGIGVYLISYAAKDVYGLYVQLFAVGVLLCGAIDALIGNGVANLSSRVSEQELSEAVADAQVLARAMGLCLGALSFVGAWVLLAQDGHSGNGWATSLSFAAYIVSLTFRDFKRVSLYLGQRATEVLRLDFSFTVCAVAGGTLLHASGKATVGQVFAVLCAANAIATLTTARVSTITKWPGFGALWTRFKQFWVITRWALPGLGTGWLGNSAYLYIAGFTLGLAATAELNASRLLLMPVTLLSVAWQQMARADVARLVGEGQRQRFVGFLAKSAVVIAAPTALYLLMLYGLFDHIVGFGSLKTYANLTYLLQFWVIYMLMYTVKSVGTSLLVGFEAYKPLLKMSVASLTLQLALLWWLPGRFGVEAVIWCLLASEALELMTVWLLLLPRYLRKLSPKAATD